MKNLISLILIVLLSYPAFSQVSHGGTPYTLGLKSASLTSKKVPDITLSVNRDSLLSERMKLDNDLKMFIVAKGIPVNLNFLDAAQKSTVDGGTLYQLSISCPDATSLGLNFSNWNLPKGGKLFVINADESVYIGAFTKDNNKPWGSMMIRPVKGDQITIEYFEPTGTSTQLIIKDVIYSLKFDSTFGQACSNSPDITSPEGDGWQDEKRSVVKVITQRNIDGTWYSMFSAALINNTALDATPYLLTANHCIHDEFEANNCIFYFNYESPSPGVDGDLTHTMVGATLMATKPDLDFCLVKISSMVPSSYRPYFSGWERSDEDLDFAVCIHHPRGDVKKIAKTCYPVKAYSTFNNDELGYRTNAHYEVTRWNEGLTEGGSSGSPLYNQNHRIIGDLTGGASTCDNPVTDDYQMFSLAWADVDSYGQQLAHWLDPYGSGISYLDGLDPYPQDRVYMYPDKELCYVNEPVTFSDHSIGNYSNFRWSFGNAASPQTATGYGPVNVAYSDTGTYTATLTVTNRTTGQDTTFTLDNYIHVFYRKAIPDFKADNTVVYVGDTVTFTNYSTGSNTSYQWSFGDVSSNDAIYGYAWGNGANPDGKITYNNDPVKVVYTTPGKKTVTLIANNPLSNANTAKPMYITVYDTVHADFVFDKPFYYEKDTVRISNLSSTGFNSVGTFFIDNTSIWLDPWFQSVIYYQVDGQDGNYADRNPWIVMSTAGTYDVKYKFTGGYFNDKDSASWKDRILNVYPAPPVDFTYSQDGENFNFSVTGSNSSSYTYAWTFDDGQVFYGSACDYVFSTSGDYKVTLAIIDANDSVYSKVQKTISVITAARDYLTQDDKMMVYPNPCNDWVNVELPEDWQQTDIKIIDITGHMMGQYSNVNKISTTNLPRGIYFVEAINNGQRYVKKLIKY